MVTALYRRYRPEAFAEVIGQEHVTTPLSVALANNRIGHAYLFSGPRGCGKTTSARILARCLNCEQGPTATPCGACDSCVALARGGAGSLDVIEIDAASHRGIDDAREIRERAVFAPASSRYKIFIIDEAHMVTKEGFNALLKIVEEPPEHVKFVFATTEPEKVIGTIRSRTHHYPFRLVPPGVLQQYLGEVCEREGVTAGPGVLSLVVRAGAGSVRDSMSVLDQLIAGSGPGGLEHGPASALLGYTDAGLLDATVDALAAVDGATLFGVVDRVIESGFDPRRFAEDLLERLRDLLIAEAVPDGTAAVLQGLPEDQLDRMRAQAARFGRAELSRAADTVNIAVTEMTGATSPRLQLELLCARLLLPGSDDAGRGLGARLDRIERRLAAGGPVQTAPVQPVAPAARPVREVVEEIPVEAPNRPAGRPGPAVAEPPAAQTRAAEPRPPAVVPAPPAAAPPAAAAPAAAAPPAAPRPAPGVDLDGIRRLWPEVLGALSGLKRATWSLVSQHADVIAFDGERLVLGFKAPNLASSFNRGAHQELTRQALISAAGVDARVEAVLGNQVPPSPAGGAPAGRAPEPSRSPTPTPAPTPTAPAQVQAPARREPQRAAPGRPAATPYPDDIPLPDEPPPDEPPVPDDGPRRAAPRQAAPPARSAPPSRSAQPARSSAPAGSARSAPPPRSTVAPVAADDDEPSMDDADVEGSNLVGAPVIEQLLGGRVIEERDA